MWRSTVTTTLTMATLVLMMASLLDAIRCHFCRDSLNNEECNANVAECTNQLHESCYTTIKLQEDGKKEFTKGCIAWSECGSKPGHSMENTCLSFSGNNCIYCCNSRSNCNVSPSSAPSLHLNQYFSWLHNNLLQFSASMLIAILL